jgi:hypothetical protein
MPVIVTTDPLPHHLYVLWIGPPPVTAGDLPKGNPLYMQAPVTEMVGGEADNEEKGLLSKQSDKIEAKTEGKVKIGTGMVEQLEKRPPRVLAVWTTPSALAAGRQCIYDEAAASGTPIHINLQGLELPQALIRDFLHNPPFGARPVVGALVDYGGLMVPRLHRIEGEPDGLVVRPSAASSYH